MKRSVRCNEYLNEQEVDNISIIEGEDDAHFTMRGCDCCDQGGCDVYDCNGYSSKHNKIFDGFEICALCICYYYNGDDSEIKDAA